MDSDYDFMSGVSSEDDVLQDESDNENASGDGKFAHLFLFQIRHTNIQV